MNTQIHIDTERLAKVQKMELSSGKHDNINEGMCFMEAVSFVAGEPWSDSPECACPIIGTFLRTWNDSLPDDERTDLLRDLIPSLVGTRSTREIEQRRATMAVDWLIRVYTPAWLRLAGLTANANSLTSLNEITDFAKFSILKPTLDEVRSDADAAWAAAKAAGRDDASDTRGAAKAAAGNAFGAGDAAKAAARGATHAAAKAGKARLLGTKRELQKSAKELVIRMCEAGTS